MSSTWVEISKSALEHNSAQYKKILGTASLAAVIKSNAYGHGLLEVAHLCQHNNDIDQLCVATLTDAVFLCSAGITKPIIVLGIIDTDPAQAINLAIDFLIFDFETAQQLNTIGKAHNCIFNVHIKIDSGLSRLGILPDDITAFINALTTLPYIRVIGMCSHFAESQKEDQSFTLEQLETFKKTTEIAQTLLSIPYVHMSNSAATTVLPLSFCTLFRVGIGIYGLWPSLFNKIATQNMHGKDFILKPVLTWKTRIVHIKKRASDQFIGYDRTAYTTHNTTIAVIPIGYYDGFDRRLSNQAFVYVRNTYAPIIGRVSMNLATINVTHIPDIKIGDEVTVLGSYPHVNAYALSERTGTDNVRELLTKISPHIPRIVIE